MPEDQTRPEPAEATLTPDTPSLVRLSAEDQVRFVEALLSPPEPTPAMILAHKHHRRLFGGA
jgi:uncharacterized protein (DUF1778 family)